MAGSKASKLKREKPQTLFLEAVNEIEKVIKSDRSSTSPIDITNAYNISQSTLEGYVLLNFKYRTAIETISGRIASYAKDSTKKRPLNIMMMAGPGSGKSYFVKCLAKKLSPLGITAVSYNMATLQDPADLFQPIETVRNLKVEDKLPILFLDECDADFDNLSLLLPLMWDGELNIGRGLKKIGKAIIILAASTETMRNAIKAAQGMETNRPFADGDNKKVIDFLSRINGGTLEIPDLDGKERLANKACIAFSLIRARFGENITKVPLSIVKFIAKSKFRYGVRSIAHLIDLIPKDSAKNDEILHAKLNKLPLKSKAKLIESGLAYHLILEGEEAEPIIETWKEVSKVETILKFM